MKAVSETVKILLYIFIAIIIIFLGAMLWFSMKPKDECYLIDSICLTVIKNNCDLDTIIKIGNEEYKFKDFCNKCGLSEEECRKKCNC